jgi:hypothetical protein
MLCSLANVDEGRKLLKTWERSGQWPLVVASAAALPLLLIVVALATGSWAIVAVSAAAVVAIAATSVVASSAFVVAARLVVAPAAKADHLGHRLECCESHCSWLIESS